MPRFPTAIALTLAIGAIAVAQTSGPPDQSTAAGSLWNDMRIQLLRNPSVREELGLTNAQASKIDAAHERMRAAARGYGDPRVRAGEREARAQLSNINEARANIVKTIEAALEDGQNARLAEIRLWRAEPWVLRLPDVERRLGLSDAQKQSIARIFDSSPTRLEDAQNAFRRDEITFEAFRQKRREIYKTMSQDAAKVLDDRQRALLREMKGEEFQYVPGTIRDPLR